MAIHDRAMYDKARNESEPEFAAVLKKHGFSDVHQGTLAQDQHHTDVIGTRSKDKSVWTFDVKDLSEVWKGKSSNYNISKDLIDKAKADRSTYAHHVHACRLYSENGLPTGEFLCIKTLDMIDKKLVFEKARKDTGKKLWLFNIRECEKKLCTWRIR